MIYTFDNKNFLLYPVMKSYFELDDFAIYNIIQNEFKKLQSQLNLKNIIYKELKGALIPNQDKNKREICFIIDTTILNKSNYGYYIFKKLIPLLDKDSTYSILYGDYVDFLYKYNNESQIILENALNEVIERCHQSNYQYSNQYFLIYFNRLTKAQHQKIVDGLLDFSWFTGFADISHMSMFKTYISNILISLCIKNKRKVIMSHSFEYANEENINECGFPFENNGFKVLSINSDFYQSFLSYKIESVLPDKEDISFSLNALFPKFISTQQIRLQISDNIWNNYLTVKTEKKRET